MTEIPPHPYCALLWINNDLCWIPHPEDNSIFILAIHPSPHEPPEPLLFTRADPELRHATMLSTTPFEGPTLNAIILLLYNAEPKSFHALFTTNNRLVILHRINEAKSLLSTVQWDPQTRQILKTIQNDLHKNTHNPCPPQPDNDNFPSL